MSFLNNIKYNISTIFKTSFVITFLYGTFEFRKNTKNNNEDNFTQKRYWNAMINRYHVVMRSR